MITAVVFSNWGIQRHRVQGLLGLLAVILSSFVVVEAFILQRLLTISTGVTLLLIWVFCGRLCSEFRAPGSIWTVHLQEPCLLNCQHQLVRIYFIKHLPSMVLLRTARRRFWLFADETSPAAWRQLFMFTRFAR